MVSDPGLLSTLVLSGAPITYEELLWKLGKALLPVSTHVSWVNTRELDGLHFGEGTRATL